MAEGLGQLVGDVAATDDDAMLGRVHPFTNRGGLVPVLEVVDAVEVWTGARGRQWVGPTPGRDQQAVVRKDLTIAGRCHALVRVQSRDGRVDEQLDTLLRVLLGRPQKDLLPFGLVAQEWR